MNMFSKKKNNRIGKGKSGQKKTLKLQGPSSVKSFEINTNRLLTVSVSKEDSIREIFTALPNAPATLRNFVGKDYVRRFMGIMTSQPAVEADWLMQCGYLISMEQAMQYSMVTGDYYSIRNELTGLACEIAEYHRENLAYLINQDMINGKGIGFLFEKIHDILYHRFLLLPNTPTIQKQFGIYFLFQVTALIGSDIVCIYNNTDADLVTRNGAMLFLAKANDVFRTMFDFDFAGLQFYGEQQLYKHTLHADALKTLRLCIGIPEYCSADFIEGLSRQNDVYVERLQNASLYKRMPLVTLNETMPQIVAVNEDEDTGTQISSFCFVRINFNLNYKIGYPIKEVDHLGNSVANFEDAPGVINMSLNRQTGDLCFIAGGIPISYILPLAIYKGLQRFVLKKILRYFENKEPDIDDFFLYSKEELAGMERINQLKQACVDEGEEIITNEVQSEKDVVTDGGTEWWKQFELREYVGDEDKEANEVSMDSDKPAMCHALPKHLRISVMHKIAGASSPKMLSALRKLLGAEVRVTGSHHIFQSPRNGKTAPVPKNSRNSKHHISDEIILSNLKIWGYSIMELALVLGMDEDEVAKHMEEENIVDTTV